MAGTWQLTFDCANPTLMTTFWAFALGYESEPPPESFPTWLAYWRHIGVPEDELDEHDEGSDSLVDPAGVGPRIWFQIVPEPKTVKNRLHVDVRASGGRSVPLPERRAQIEARVAELVGAGATRVRTLETEGLDHYGVTLTDPEGNEFCVN